MNRSYLASWQSYLKVSVSWSHNTFGVLFRQIYVNHWRCCISTSRMEFYTAIFDEYRKKNPRRPITEEKKNPQSFWPPNPPKISYGRHWGVVRRAMIWSLRAWAWKVRRVRNSGVTVWAGAQRKNCVITALSLSPEGFELPCTHRLDPMTMKLFVHLSGT